MFAKRYICCLGWAGDLRKASIITWIYRALFSPSHCFLWGTWPMRSEGETDGPKLARAFECVQRTATQIRNAIGAEKSSSPPTSRGPVPSHFADISPQSRRSRCRLLDRSDAGRHGNQTGDAITISEVIPHEQIRRVRSIFQAARSSSVDTLNGLHPPTRRGLKA